MRKLALSLAVAFAAVAGATAASASASVLLGDQTVTSHGDSNNAGVAQAFEYTATASGTASDIDLYINSGTAATKVLVGVYSDRSGRPSALLTSGTTSSPKAGSWNDITLTSSVGLSKGQSYWIALLGTGGQLKYPDTPGGSAPSYVNATTGLTALPQTYSPGKRYNLSPASAYVNGATATATVLMGDPSMASSPDSDNAGVAQAFAYTATASGTTSDINLYVNSGSTATKLMLGVYNDASGKPGSLIASGSLSSPQAAAWNDVRVGSATLTAGIRYWIALLGTGGQLNYPDTWGGSQASYVDSGVGLSSLPSTYASGTEYNVSPASAYVDGFTGSATSPPAITSAPAISGSAVQGHSLSASTGSWSGSPTSYAYQWQDCDSSGANCTNISGATSNTYVLVAADVGHTIRAVVTATNGFGSSTPASSNQTGVVTASGLLYGSQGGPYASVDGNWPGGSWQPYGSTSYWNTPLPAAGSAVLYNCSTCGSKYNSASVIAYMAANWPARSTPWTFSNTVANDEASAWNHPLYWAKSTDPLYTISGTANCNAGSGATFCPTKLRIPNGAVAASGSDNHLSVVEPAGFYATGGTDPQGRPANEVDEIDFYQAGHQTFSGGGTVTPSYKGGFSIDDPSGCCGNSNATDTGLEGGTITAPQLATGTINHALAISADCMNGYVVAPAPTAIQGFYPTSGGDCAGSPPGDGPPDGARLQYKLSDSQIDALPVDALEKMYLKAAAHYGVIVTDTGGAPADPKFEPIVTYSPFESKNAQGQYPQSMMTWIENNIPGSTDPFTETMTWNWSDWQVVSPCYSTTPPSC